MEKSLINVAATEQLICIIQSILFPKEEPLKLWLAQVSRERIEKTIDPKLTIERAIEIYIKCDVDICRTVVVENIAEKKVK